MATCGHLIYPICGCVAEARSIYDHVPDAAMRADGFFNARQDGWASALTGIGTFTNDKRLSHQFYGEILSYRHIVRMWEASALTKRAIEAQGDECFREGYEYEFPNESKFEGLKEDLEGAMRDLGVNHALKRAQALKRAVGGAAVMLGVKDGRPLEAPLDKTNIQSFDHLNVLEPIEISPARYQLDVRKPGYGQPDLYVLTGAHPLSPHAAPESRGSKDPSEYAQVLVHASRLLIFRGIKASNYYYEPVNSDLDPFWGASVVPQFVEALRDYGLGFSSAGILIAEASQMVFAAQGLMNQLASNEQAVIDRARALKMAQSIARMNLIDKDRESITRVGVNFGGVSDILDRLSQRLAADVGTPLSVLIGYTPATLGKPDTDELTQWHNTCRTVQTDEFEEPVRTITDLKIREMRERKIPKHYLIHWKDLASSITSQRVETELNQSRKDNLDLKGGIVTSQEVRDSRYRGGYSHKTQIDESKKAPGFLAPLPAGVLPKAMNPNAVIESTEAGNKPAISAATGAPGPGGHTVGGYVRRNPAAPMLGASPKAGGDAPPGERGDALEAGQVTTYAGLPILIENPKGSTRDWVDSDGTTGTTKMRYDYGEIVGTCAPDGDPLDVYLGPSEGAPFAYAVQQMSKKSNFQAFDELKIMVGFDSAAHARDAYQAQYDDPRFYGGMDEMPIETLRAQVPETLRADRIEDADIAMHLDRIKHEGSKFVVTSEDGTDRLGEYDTEEEAVHRLQQVEYWKAHRSATR